MTLISTMLVSFAVMLIVIAAMAIGVMNGRRPISGSCGGLNSGGCELCSGKCKRESEQ
jgi:hypothetical protein